MKISIRCQAISMAQLAGQESHAKRTDRTSKFRVIRDCAPLVAGSLDLRAQFDQHASGAKQNVAAKKPILHFILKFPNEILTEDFGHFKGSKKQRQKMMMKQALNFIQNTHGGNAAFAARVDRDESGETIVDVFASPKYEKRTKRTKPDQKGATWLSSTKFGKKLAEKHKVEIKRRHPNAKASSLTGPRMVGIALNSEFRNFFERANAITLDQKKEKTSNQADRLEIEGFKRVRDAEAHINKKLDRDEDQLERDREAFERDQSRLEANFAVEKRKLAVLAECIKNACAIFASHLRIEMPQNLQEAVEKIEAAVSEMDEPAEPDALDEPAEPGF